MVVVYFESFWLLYFIAKLPSHKSCAAEGLIFSASVPVLFQQQFKKMDRFVLGFKPVKQFFTSRSNTIMASLLSSCVLWLRNLYHLPSPSFSISIFHCPLYLFNSAKQTHLVGWALATEDIHLLIFSFICLHF